MRKKSLSFEIDERVKEVANYMIANNATVRATAKALGVSKSTVHKYVTERIEKVSPSLAKEVRKVLNKNKEERAARGGEATRRKFLAKKTQA